jgi:hypothetical protein
MPIQTRFGMVGRGAASENRPSTSRFDRAEITEIVMQLDVAATAAVAGKPRV